MKGKEWYQIAAPKFFNEEIIGETTTIDSERLKGRKVEASLLEFTEDPTKYYIKLFFKIDSVNGTKAYTVFVGHECTRDFIARIVQPRTTRIDINEVVNFKDSSARVKAIAITNRKVTNKIEKILGKTLREKVIALKDMTLEEFVKGFTSGKIQNDIKNSVNKIYPLRFFEFRKTEVLK